MSLLTLYLIFCKIGAITFGGGYAMIPLLQDELVTRSGLISPQDFTTMAALAQLTPGAIGLNMATFIGNSHAGLLGAFVTTGGLLTPPFVITVFMVYLFRRFAANLWMARVISGIRPVMLGLIATAVLFFLEVSVFTAPVPWKKWFSDCFHTPSPEEVQWGIDPPGATVFAVVLLTMAKFKLSVPTVLLTAALVRIGIWAVCGN